MADAILCHGGSNELVKICNRLGACVSNDTHSRIQAWVVSQHISRGISSDLIRSTFSVVSIDNVDICSPNALVSCTQTQRRWHGTSVATVHTTTAMEYPARYS